MSVGRAQWTLGAEWAKNSDAFVKAPAAGEHRLELEVADAIDKARAATSFVHRRVGES